MQLAKGAGKDILRSESVNRLCSICLKTALTWQKCSAIILLSKHLVILAQLIFMAVFKAVGVWKHGLALRFKMPFLLGIQTSVSSCLHPGKVDLMLFAASDSRFSWTKAKPPRVWLLVSVQKQSLQQNWEFSLSLQQFAALCMSVGHSRWEVAVIQHSGRALASSSHRFLPASVSEDLCTLNVNG